jgi:hypothetical protein
MKRIVFLPIVFVAMSIQLVRSAETSAPIERPEAEKNSGLRWNLDRGHH